MSFEIQSVRALLGRTVPCLARFRLRLIALTQRDGERLIIQAIRVHERDIHHRYQSFDQQRARLQAASSGRVSGCLLERCARRESSSTRRSSRETDHAPVSYCGVLLTLVEETAK